jgi:1-deoxy-D-xylulose-5-phosphate synthase
MQKNNTSSSLTNQYGKYLSNINSPEDLRKYDLSDLQEISEECRNFVIDMISRNGGHFGSTLGVAELSVALHYAYNTPQDKLIWDVGHQAYIHKILTGRRDVFHSNRKYKGISGFPKRCESPYDTFGVGHASTSISAAAGMAAARDLAKEDYKVAAVIGDGSLTGGLAFEGLNHIGHLKTDVTIILNDNCMSIDQNVGGLRNYLTDFTTSSTYNKLRRDIWETLSRFDNEIGSTARRVVRGIEDGLKAALTPGSFFEALGFRYFGPVDGHNAEHLAKILSEIKNMPHPKLLHVITVKGKGFKPAEENQTKWHAASGAFDRITGDTVSKPKTSDSPPKYQDVFGQAMVELATDNKSLVGITAAMPSGTSLSMLRDSLPDQFYDVGIAEGHAVTFAAGLATQGLHPVCAIYSTFLQRAFDHVIHDVALQKLPVMFCLDRAGFAGADGPTHHGTFDISYLRVVPNMMIMAPMNEQELRDMMYTASLHKDGPVAIRYPRGNATGMKLEKGFKKIEIGKGEILQDGEEIAILSAGVMGNHALKAAELLKAQGVNPLLANMRFVKPLDTDLIDAICERFPRIVTLEENSVVGGFGSGVLEYIQSKQYRNQVLIMGIPDRFIDHGSAGELQKEIGLDPEGITRRILEFSHSENLVEIT